MTAEALSNVHRHTDSRNVTVGVALADNSLVLTIENDAPRELPALFTPLSIFERAEALGARTEVASGKGKTRVRVEVPL
jgi:signal transduction histidine kinase